MRNKWVAVIMVVLLAVLLPGGVSQATPTPPYVLVNNTTKQCAISILGDDCSWCNPPAGWEVLGVSGVKDCPAGYERLERINLNCRRYKNQFCCTSVSHHGNCEDLVVNHSQKQCGFVADITSCLLPEGWSKRPLETPEPSWNCPYNYQWVANVDCMDPTAAAALTQAAGQTLAALSTPTRSPQANGKSGSASSGSKVLPYALAASGGALLILLGRAIGRRKSKKYPHSTS